MYSEMHLYPAKVKEIHHNFLDEMISVLASYFTDLQKRGHLRNFNAELAARAFLGMFFSFFNAQRFLPKSEAKNTDTEMVITTFADIFIRGTEQIAFSSAINKEAWKGMDE
jgi:hypothetical protein